MILQGDHYFMDYDLKALPKVTSNHVQVYFDGNVVSENFSNRRIEGL